MKFRDIPYAACPDAAYGLRLLPPGLLQQVHGTVSSAYGGVDPSPLGSVMAHLGRYRDVWFPRELGVAEDWHTWLWRAVRRLRHAVSSY